MEPGDNLPSHSPPVYSDRGTGLVIYGILEIVAGGFCALLIPLVFISQALTGARIGMPQYRLMLPAVLVYAMLAVIFVTLGIGSIRARRWARALGLILGWTWLLMGAIEVVVYAFLLPKILSSGPVGGAPLPTSAKLIIVGVGIAFFAIVMVVAPVAVVLFYRSPNVLATCQARDPEPCWTDNCPLPVLALTLWLGLGAAFMWLMPAAYNGVAPFFGMLLSGFAGWVFYLCLGICFGLLARGLYRLNPAAWWLLLGLMAVAAVSNFITFAQIDLEQLYRLMGYPQAQIQQLRSMNFMSPDFMAVLSALGFVPMLAYLFYVRQFFRAPYRRTV